MKRRGLFGFLLRLYPRRFRDRFGLAMAAVFRERHREVRQRGSLHTALFWLSTCWDMTRLALLERFANRNSTRAPNSRPRLRASAATHARLRDVRTAWRSLTKHPTSTVAAVTMFALGIGLVTTVFSIVYGSTIRGLPFEEAARLVHFERRNLEQDLLSMAVTPHDYLAWKEQQRSFEQLAAFVESSILIRDDVAAPEPEIGVRIDAEAFALLRVQPAIGRSFTAEEDAPGGPKVILLSHALWESRYGRDENIVGKSILITDGSTEPHTVIGVMPEGFGFPIAERYWLPLQLDVNTHARGTGRLDVFGRLTPRASFDDARQEFALISARLAAAYPETNAGVEATLATFQQEYVGPDFSKRVRLMFAGALLVLLIACLNVANLLVARAVRRTGEVAIRTALGASRREITLMMLTEAAVISIIGGILGVGLAFLGVQWFGNALLYAGALRLPHGGDALFWWRFKLDLVPLSVAFLATAGCAIGAGLLPIVQASGSDVVGCLKESGRNSASPRIRRLGRMLVTVEVALAAALLTATALTLKSLYRIGDLDLGFPPDQVVTARVGLYGERYENDGDRRIGFWSELSERAQVLSGVTHVSLSTSVPMLSHRPVRFQIRGRVSDDGRPLVARHATVSPGFFSAFGLRPTSGRTFTADDVHSNANVMVVNESFASQFFNGESPLGRIVSLESRGNSVDRTIVGVVPDGWVDGERNRDRSGLYLPLAGATPLDLILAVRGEHRVPTLDELRSVMGSLDPEQPLYNVRTMHDVIATRTGRFAVYGTLYVLLGLAALLLSVVGLYGVIAFNVTQRRSEFGIRMALGADDDTVLYSVLRFGLVHVAAGLVLGAGLAYWISRGLESVLFQVEPWDPAAFALAGLLLLATGLGASVFPALRARRLSLTTVLREE